jgi:hypothetical protein
MAGIDTCKVEVPLAKCERDERIYWLVLLYLPSICKLDVSLIAVFLVIATTAGHLLLTSTEAATNVPMISASAAVGSFVKALIQVVMSVVTSVYLMLEARKIGNREVVIAKLQIKSHLMDRMIFL